MTLKKIILINVGIFVILVFLRWPWLSYEFLIEDDNIFYGKSYFGEDFLGNERIVSVNHWLFDFLVTHLRQVIFLRLAYLCILSSVLSFVYYALRNIIEGSAGILLILIIAATNPVNVEQGLFLIGSHPLIASCFILVSTGLMLLFLSEENRVKFYVLSLLVVVSSVLSLNSGSTSQIAPVAFIVFLFYPISVGKQKVEKRILIALTGLLPIIIKFIQVKASGNSYNHYSGNAGWLKVSFDNIQTQFSKAISMLVDFIGFSGVVGVTVAIIALLSASLFYLYKDYDANERRGCLKERYVIAFFFLILSALFFGPISIVTTMVPRYLFGSLVFFTLFIGIALSANSLSRTLLYKTKLVILAVICCFFVVISKNNSKNNYLDVMWQHREIDTLVSSRLSTWKPNAQVIIVSDYRMTQGFNHWSTWYMRYLSKRRDLISVIGVESWLTDVPIVDKYYDHHGVFWKTVNGRTRRIKMIGIEEDRPTYIYYKDGEYFSTCKFILLLGDGSYDLFSADENGLIMISRNENGYEGLMNSMEDRKQKTLIYKLNGYKNHIPKEIADYLEL
jgi:hypothetical protein